MRVQPAFFLIGAGTGAICRDVPRICRGYAAICRGNSLIGDRMPCRKEPIKMRKPTAFTVGSCIWCAGGDSNPDESYLASTSS